MSNNVSNLLKTLPITVKLTSNIQWPEWWRQYRATCQVLCIWSTTNPDTTPAVNESIVSYLIFDEFKEEKKNESKVEVQVRACYDILMNHLI
jgi:hypothetical protein